MFDPSWFFALGQVILIDLVLAGDNAVVIGLAAAGLAPDLRRQAILIGIIAATVLRICFALVTTQLLRWAAACWSRAVSFSCTSAGRCISELAVPHDAHRGRAATEARNRQ